MTVNDAIMILRESDVLDLTLGDTPARQAVNMAISALEAQELSNNSPKLDSGNGELISRHGVIDVFRMLFPDKLMSDVESELKKLPSAQRWIPVSERLPEKDGYYLVSGRWVDGGEKVVTDCEYHVHDGFYFMFMDVIAWQPLPEPYQEESV